MAEIEIEYILKLTHYEGQELKRLLGQLTGNDYVRLGIEGVSREGLSEIYNLIPHPDED